MVIGESIGGDISEVISALTYIVIHVEQYYSKILICRFDCDFVSHLFELSDGGFVCTRSVNIRSHGYNWQLIIQVIFVASI